MAFTTFEEMYNEYMKECKNAIKEIAPNEMKKLLSEAVEIEVYGKYDPTMYKRRGRGNGGLASVSNYTCEFLEDSNMILISVHNNTRGNSNIRQADAKGSYIDSIIVSGSGYTWKNSGIARNPMPRDFYKKAEELFEQGDIVQKIIRILKGRGITFL